MDTGERVRVRLRPGDLFHSSAAEGFAVIGCDPGLPDAVGVGAIPLLPSAVVNDGTVLTLTHDPIAGTRCAVDRCVTVVPSPALSFVTRSSASGGMQGICLKSFSVLCLLSCL